MAGGRGQCATGFRAVEGEAHPATQDDATTRSPHHRRGRPSFQIYKAEGQNRRGKKKRGRGGAGSGCSPERRRRAAGRRGTHRCCPPSLPPSPSSSAAGIGEETGIGQWRPQVVMEIGGTRRRSRRQRVRTQMSMEIDRSIDGSLVSLLQQGRQHKRGRPIKLVEMEMKRHVKGSFETNIFKGTI